MRRLITATANITRPHHRVRINKGMKADLHTWLKFFDAFNGVSVFSDKLWVSNVDLQLLQIVLEKLGMVLAFILTGKWAYSVWPDSWCEGDKLKDRTFLEFFPILVSVVLWGEHLRNKKLFSGQIIKR